MTPAADAIARSLAEVRARIARAASAAGRDPSEVTLVAVSKTVPAARVRLAYEAGVRDFGENRVQEGVAKVAELALPDATWHLIGHLQTNKARPAARSFGMIHSVDSRRVGEALAGEGGKLGTTLDVLLEVNFAGEESKFGFSPDEALAEATAIAGLPNLRVLGLMTVAPLVDDAELVRPLFRAMRQLGEAVRPRLGNPSPWHLSMGMTNDFEVAIEEGATIVRVGRAIFGERQTVG
ncbi:MAG TPA: YggS family pyridoxal phosphate-dependent enzyme [Chloroflexota bacterium]